jgi:NADPH:quinone reductase-like Zn-dependent oxidoreductase
VKCPDGYVSLKPKNLSFADAASLPLAGVTALQVLGQYKGTLEGKTVFIPAGCKSYITPVIKRNADASV